MLVSSVGEPDISTEAMAWNGAEFASSFGAESKRMQEPVSVR